MIKVVEKNVMTKIWEGRAMTSRRYLWVAASMIGVLASSVQASEMAAESTQTFESLGQVLTVEGPARCDQFAIGSEIIELQEENPVPRFDLEGPQRQEITGRVPDGTVLEWEATVPVDFVIVVGTKNDNDDDGAISNVYVFGDDPAPFDQGEIAPNMSTVRQVRFCYGLPVVQEPLPSCAEIEDGSQCPLLGDEQEERNGALVFFDFDQPDFGADQPPCVCGSTELLDCNEKLLAGQEGTCAGGELQAVEVVYVATKSP
jgi:hypothetical protein